MTSAASQSSDTPSRQQRMLAALDIDVWITRSAVTANETTQVAAAAEPPASHSLAAAGEPIARSGAGPAAALALLEQSTQSGSAWDTSSSHSVESAAIPDAVGNADDGVASVVEPEPLDLWCLSGSHGVLLAQHAGIGPHAQRLLKDVLLTAARVIDARLLATLQDDTAKPARTKLQALRFTWPPAQQVGSDAVSQDTTRALRGFLNRQLKGAVEPVLLYVGGDLTEVLDKVDLSIPVSRQLVLAPPEQLMSDSTAKRALWRTLSAL